MQLRCRCPSYPYPVSRYLHECCSRRAAAVFTGKLIPTYGWVAGKQQALVSERQESGSLQRRQRRHKSALPGQPLDIQPRPTLLTGAIVMNFCTVGGFREGRIQCMAADQSPFLPLCFSGCSACCWHKQEQYQQSLGYPCLCKWCVFTRVREACDV